MPARLRFMRQAEHIAAARQGFWKILTWLKMEGDQPPFWDQTWCSKGATPSTSTALHSAQGKAPAEGVLVIRCGAGNIE